MKRPASERCPEAPPLAWRCDQLAGHNRVGSSRACCLSTTWRVACAKHIARSESRNAIENPHITAHNRGSRMLLAPADWRAGGRSIATRSACESTRQPNTSHAGRTVHPPAIAHRSMRLCATRQRVMIRVRFDSRIIWNGPIAVRRRITTAARPLRLRRPAANARSRTQLVVALKRLTEAHRRKRPLVRSSRTPSSGFPRRGTC